MNPEFTDSAGQLVNLLWDPVSVITQMAKPSPQPGIDFNFLRFIQIIEGINSSFSLLLSSIPWCRCLFVCFKYMVIFVIIIIFIVAVLRLEFSGLVYDKQGYNLL